MMTLRKLSMSLLAVGMLFASSTFAQQAGDNMISLGVNYITPKINNSNPSVVGSDNLGGAIVSGVQSGLNGTTASVNNAFVGTISYARMLTDNWAGELQLGLPPTMNLNLNTPNATNSQAPTLTSAPTHNNAASAKFFAPVVMAKYYFGVPKDALRPYLGVGATHVSFHNVQINRGDQVVSDIAGQGARLNSAWAPVFNAGALYNLDQSWFIQGGMAYVPIKTTLTMNGTTVVAGGAYSASTTTTTSINFNTLEYVFKLGYKF